MKSVEIVGFKRANLGKAYAKELREKAEVPCVLYGGKESVHFSVPMYLFRELIYTPEVKIVELNIEGDKYKAILQDAQFHPVSEMILHVDFLELKDDKEVKISVPVKVKGTAEGVTKGGKLNLKLRKIKIKALPKNLPDYVEVDVTNLDLGKSIKVGQLKPENYQILSVASVPVVSVDIPRALKGKMAEGANA
jgi:large subunit ribosomal protein L25